MRIKNDKKFEPVPEGLYDAVCVDVVDLGMVPGMYGEKHKLKIVWEVSLKMADGRPFTISQRYTASLSPKANLYKDLKAIRGSDFTKEELKDFEMEKVLGSPCKILVEHNEKEGEVYANVGKIMKATDKLAASGKYKRAKDRDDYVAPRSVTESAQEDSKDSGSQASDPELEKDSIPF